MASTTFIDQQTIIYADWLNDTNNAVYNGVFPNGSLTLTTLAVSGSVSGTGFTNLVNNTLSAPGAIGSATPNTGAFTTLTATTPIAVTSGGTGTSTKTGTGSVVLGTSPTIATPTITGNITDGTYTTSVAKCAQGTAKAWVNFDASGTIRSSYNVSSVTVDGSGVYTITFTTPMANANYLITGNCNTPGTQNGSLQPIFASGTLPSTTSFQCLTVSIATNGQYAFSYNNVVVFGS